MQDRHKILKLSNGQTVIFEHFDNALSVQVGIFYKIGSAYESDEVRGISHFIEHMMFKGTKNRSARQLADDCERLGSMQNAYTGKELTCYYIKSLAESLGASVEMLADMLYNSLLDEDELNKERKVILEEMKMYDDSPEDKVFDMLLKVVYDDHSLGEKVIGSEASVNNIDRAKCLKHMQDYYNPSNSIIVITGSYDETEAMGLLESHFGKAIAGDKVSPLSTPIFHSGYDFHKMDLQQSHIQLAFKGVPINTPEYYDITIYSHILGVSMGSRLFQSLREEQGLCYSISSGVDAYNDHGIFHISSSVAIANTALAIKAIMAEVEKMCDGVTDDELNRSQNSYKAMHAYASESSGNRLSTLGRTYLTLGRILSVDQILANISAVTKERIQSLAKKIFDKNHLAMSIVSGEEIDAKAIYQEITR